MKKLTILALVAALMAGSALAQTVHYPSASRYIGTTEISEQTIPNIQNDISTGTVHSLNGIAGDVTLVEGSNITLETDASNKTITVSAASSAQVQSDWDVTDTNSPAYIVNKPTIPTVPTDVGDLNNDAGYITASDLVQSDWGETDTEDPAYIANKPDLITSNVVSEVAQYIVNEMAANGWEVDGTYYKLVVQPFTPPLPAETTFTLDDGTKEVVDISGTLDRQWMIGHGYYNNGWIKNIGEAEIGTNVTSIGQSAFEGCSGLTSATIGNGVTNIGGWAFYNCSGLTSVTIPDSVTSIGQSAFEGCSGLTSATIGNGVTSIVGAFYSCSNLISVTIGDSVTDIGRGAFYNCSGLTSVTIPDSVTSIGDYAFYGCSGLTSVSIPGSVTSIGEKAFRDCSGLTNVTIPDSVTSIGEEAFFGCAFDLYDTNSIPGVRLVDGWAVGNQSPSGDLYLTGVRGIGAKAFRGCSGLTSVTIPDSVTSIGGSAFSGCSGLTSVTIPDSVTSIWSYAFYNCSKLKSVTMSGKTTTQVSGMSNYPWQLPSGCVITCSDGTITIP